MYQFKSLNASLHRLRPRARPRQCAHRRLSGLLHYGGGLQQQEHRRASQMTERRVTPQSTPARHSQPITAERRARAPAAGPPQ